MKRKPKITDVAKASGFSIATVSHVINGSRPVSAETAAKVNAAIAALGYVPDSSARSFKTGRHHLVGYIAPDIGNRFFSLILEELEDALALRGYNLLVINTRENGQRELDGFQVLTNGLTDGVICASTFQDYADLKPAIPKNFPLVMIDRLPKNYSGDSVRVSCYDAIREAIHALVQVGHRRIGLIASIGRLSTTVERLNAYCDALKEEGIEVDPALIKQGRQPKPKRLRLYAGTGGRRSRCRADLQQRDGRRGHQSAGQPPHDHRQRYSGGRSAGLRMAPVPAGKRPHRGAACPGHGKIRRPAAAGPHRGS